ncbi:MAG: hypothetical protein ACM31C_08035 [Acidobacteriota bacterium]
MTTLAEQIYRRLLRRARDRRPGLTYAALAASLCPPVHPRSPALHRALGEVSHACRHAKLACLPALVARADTHRPSTGYYRVAHPRAATDEARISAWEREHARVFRELARYPPRI